MTAEQFWQYWDDKKWAKPSPEIVKPVCVAFAEAYHRTEAAAQLAEKEREIERLRRQRNERGEWGRQQALRAEAAEERLQEYRDACGDLSPTDLEKLLDKQAEDMGLNQLTDLVEDIPTIADLRERLRQREAELEQALKLMRNYARGAISAELFRTKTETLLAEFTARQPLPSPPKEAKS